MAESVQHLVHKQEGICGHPASRLKGPGSQGRKNENSLKVLSHLSRPCQQQTLVRVRMEEKAYLLLVGVGTAAATWRPMWDSLRRSTEPPRGLYIL